MATTLNVVRGVEVVEVVVEESFDTVFDKLYPLQQPASSLEARQNIVYHDAETGRRQLIPAGLIGRVVEGDDG